MRSWRSAQIIDNPQCRACHLTWPAFDAFFFPRASLSAQRQIKSAAHTSIHDPQSPRIRSASVCILQIYHYRRSRTQHTIAKQDISILLRWANILPCLGERIGLRHCFTYYSRNMVVRRFPILRSVLVCVSFLWRSTPSSLSSSVNAFFDRSATPRTAGSLRPRFRIFSSDVARTHNGVSECCFHFLTPDKSLAASTNDQVRIYLVIRNKHSFVSFWYYLLKSRLAFLSF